MSPSVLAFDGDCAFCSTTARFLERWAPASTGVIAWQHCELTAWNLTEAQVTAAVQWSDGSQTAAGPEALANYLHTGRRGSWRLVGGILGNGWVLRVAWPVYRWVARNRYRLPGGTPACRLSSGG